MATGIASPGLFCWVPYLNGYGGSVSLRNCKLDCEVETKTKDDVFVSVSVCVIYKVNQSDRDELYKAFYSLAFDPRQKREQIRDNIRDVIRGTCPRWTVDELFEAKETLAQKVTEHLGSFLTAHGYHIIDSLITDIDPDDRVKKAMNMINESRRKREAAKETAEAYKIETIVKSDAEAIAMELRGKGVANQRRAIVAGMQSSVAAFTDSLQGMSAKDVMELILMSQYFDTVKELSQNSVHSTLFLPHNIGSVTDLCQELHNGIITSHPSAKAIAM